jgi:hypothetical protein
MRRRISTTGILLCGAASWCLIAATPGVAQDSVFRSVKPPSSILDRAWSYIEEQVGADYARANYELADTSASYYDSPPLGPTNEPSWYWLSFRYRPLSRLGVDDTRIFLKMFMQGTGSVIGCVARLEGSHNVVEPRVSRAEALRIAKTADIEGLDMAKAKPHFDMPIGEDCDDPWVWRIETPVIGATGSCREMIAAVVDSATGVLTVEHPGTSCTCTE